MNILLDKESIFLNFFVDEKCILYNYFVEMKNGVVLFFFFAWTNTDDLCLLFSRVRPPPVIWAQRTNLLYVTICLEDCKNPTIDVQSDKIHFKGIGGTDAKEHEVTINLYQEIDSDKTVKNEKGRLFELVLIKKEEGPYWPRLTKENKKYHWLKIDFSKWKDEDDSEDEEGNAGEGPGDMNQVIYYFKFKTFILKKEKKILNSFRIYANFICIFCFISRWCSQCSVVCNHQKTISLISTRLTAMTRIFLPLSENKI